MGHLHRVQQGIRSTKKLTIKDLMESEEDEDVKMEKPRKLIDQKHKVAVQVLLYEELKGMISTDQTGRYPIRSARGNHYIMVLYDFDNNVILAEAIKSRKKMDLLQGYNALYEMLQQVGIIPVLHKLDNEASE